MGDSKGGKVTTCRPAEVRERKERERVYGIDRLTVTLGVRCFDSETTFYSRGYQESFLFFRVWIGLD